ncbi:YvaD family protein [Paenibacillus sp. OSY-SE]|uniref:YvaD family protein n=1 Tax=Paenibacillus sp. OSY-SE TaxID=1196323 RepID=UPI0002E9E5C1|nr:YvaD family protein [Paenibacillus sp. OSY-SE]
MRWMRVFFWITDVGFILYWAVTALELIPPQYLYSDYSNPILVAWNWSFMPLDLLISFTGLYSMLLQKREREAWRMWALISLVLTFCSGLQAISYWAIRLEFDLAWWIPNVYLLLYPLCFIPLLLRRQAVR